MMTQKDKEEVAHAAEMWRLNAERNKRLAEEAENFAPLHTTLDDFKDEETYKNVKEDYLNSTINKNPVYKSIKPRIGKMIIDKETGERKIIHED